MSNNHQIQYVLLTDKTPVIIFTDLIQNRMIARLVKSVTTA